MLTVYVRKVTRWDEILSIMNTMKDNVMMFCVGFE